VAIQRSYSEARAHLAELMDRAEDDRETVIITRHGKPSTVLISAEEWESMEATLHLLRSPRNAARLFEAMAQVERGEGVEMTLEELRSRVGLDE
jgi:antitoxin YefM